MIKTTKHLIHIVTQLFHLWQMSKKEVAFAAYGEAVEAFIKASLHHAKALREIGTAMFEDEEVPVPTALSCEPPCTVPDIGDAP